MPSGSKRQRTWSGAQTVTMLYLHGNETMNDLMYNWNKLTWNKKMSQNGDLSAFRVRGWKCGIETTFKWKSQNHRMCRTQGTYYSRNAVIDLVHPPGDWKQGRTLYCHAFVISTISPSFAIITSWPATGSFRIHCRQHAHVLTDATTI